jgi:tRNA uridine 5-carboxymethylaminomethyl modification enzyme
LLLRQDNALRRLMPIAERLGLLSDDERRVAERRLREEDRALEVAQSQALTPAEFGVAVPHQPPPAEPERIARLVRRPGVTLAPLLTASGHGGFAPEVVEAAEVELKYEGYLARERQAAQRLAELADFALPMDLPYAGLRSLSIEARQKLERVQPVSLAQAGRIPGVSPADLHNLVLEVLRRRRGITA